MLTGIWTGQDVYRLHNPANGREMDLIIPGSKLMEPKALAELVQWQTEESAAEMGVPDPKPMGKAERKAEAVVGKVRFDGLNEVLEARILLAVVSRALALDGW